MEDIIEKILKVRNDNHYGFWYRITDNDFLVVEKYQTHTEEFKKTMTKEEIRNNNIYLYAYSRNWVRGLYDIDDSEIDNPLIIQVGNYDDFHRLLPLVKTIFSNQNFNYFYLEIDLNPGILYEKFDLVNDNYSINSRKLRKLINSVEKRKKENEMEI